MYVSMTTTSPTFTPAHAVVIGTPAIFIGIADVPPSTSTVDPCTALTTMRSRLNDGGLADFAAASALLLPIALRAALSLASMSSTYDLLLNILTSESTAQPPPSVSVCALTWNFPCTPPSG